MKTWIEYDGVIVEDRRLAIGVAGVNSIKGHDDKKKIEAWIPKRYVGRITYKEGGDSVVLRKGKRFEAIEVELWVAQTNGWA